MNQTLGTGGYETEIANALYGDLSGAGIPATGSLHDALAALGPDSTILDSASRFHGALVDLHFALVQTAFTDLLGMFWVDAGGAAADAASAFDLPF